MNLYLDDDDSWLEKYPEPDNDDPIDFGPCCICECTGRTVHNVFMLSKQSPYEGQGWGCFECDLPMRGATAILCDRCLRLDDPIASLRFFCAPKDGNFVTGRAPISELDGQPHFDHDMSKHPDEVNPREF